MAGSPRFVAKLQYRSQEGTGDKGETAGERSTVSDAATKGIAWSEAGVAPMPGAGFRKFLPWVI